MLGLDISGIKKYIDDSGLKQKSVAEKAGLDEVKFCLILQGKRKLEASEYANLCKAIGVSMNKFLKPRMPDKTKGC
mgnify:CR=1 FL=1